MNIKFALLLIIILALFSTAVGQENKPKIDSLGWLAGCWEQNDEVKNRFGSEHWMKPSGGTMIGMSRTVKNGKTAAFEFLRIVEDEKGIFYISKPSQNSGETTFELVKSSPGEVTFENPAHNFPQRIIYRLDKTNLFARIEGTNNGKQMGIDFPMVKARCN